ncbi:MarR family winged helix-turn-helix transcriptional regulator [Actinocorallia longicatena]|uniref:MarR family transcriptional regulator n=1 Tax=Actinocorallia longicatena TaxID=111803 RepID=A0ABP6QFE6_9ACTN
MDDEKALPATVAFRLGTLGSRVAERYAERLRPFGLKPKHAGLLAVLSRGPAASQQDLAGELRVAPSLVVSLADELERLGAVERVRDPHDRRRQVLTLTDGGRALLASCTTAAAHLDAELLAPLTPDQRRALDEALALLSP